MDVYSFQPLHKFLQSHPSGQSRCTRGENNDAGLERGQKIYVEFADNGDGIPPQNQDRIFNAFFTTTATLSAEEDDQDLSLGTGLGLKIIKDIVSSYRGEIYLAGAPREYVTCFRIELPAATEKELEGYGK